MRESLRMQQDKTNRISDKSYLYRFSLVAKPEKKRRADGIRLSIVIDIDTFSFIRRNSIPDHPLPTLLAT